MSKLVVTGNFFINQMPEYDGERVQPGIGNQVVFQAEISRNNFVVFVNCIDDPVDQKHALQPLLEIIQRVYPELFVQQ